MRPILPKETQTTDKPFPLVSVCIPVFNGERYVEQAISSVIGQGYPNLEILLQDNASTDGTWTLLEKLARMHPIIAIERNLTNIGMAPNWNKVINRAKGDFVMLLSADDMLEPGFLSACLAKFMSEDVDCVVVNHFILKNGKKLTPCRRAPEGIHQNMASLILCKNPFSINFSLFRRTVLDRLKECGSLFSNSNACDYDVWIRIACQGLRVRALSDRLGVYRVHETNLSKTAWKQHMHDTYIVLHRNRENLLKRCPFVYRFTLTRLALRVCRQTVSIRSLRYRGFDFALFKKYIEELMNS